MLIQVTESIHKVIQGEGPNIGKKMGLIRLSGCPVKCPECDSKHTWSPQHRTPVKDYTIDQMIEEIENFVALTRINTILFSGGEPGLYFQELGHMIRKLKEKPSNRDINFEVETTGLYSCKDLVEADSTIFINFSPKIGALQKASPIKKWRAFEEKISEPMNFPRFYSLKIVVSVEEQEENLREIADFKAKYNIPNDRIYLMPLGVTREEILKQVPGVLEIAYQNYYNFSPRMHILMFDSKRLV